MQLSSSWSSSESEGLKASGRAGEAGGETGGDPRLPDPNTKLIEPPRNDDEDATMRMAGLNRRRDPHSRLCPDPRSSSIHPCLLGQDLFQRDRARSARHSLLCALFVNRVNLRAARRFATPRFRVGRTGRVRFEGALSAKLA